MTKTTKLLAIFLILSFLIFECACSFAALKTGKTEKEKLFVTGRPTIFCFGGSYCPACKKALPALMATQKKYAGRATILYLDVEKDREVTREFPLQVVPTYFFYDKNGKTYIPSKKAKEQIEFNEIKNRKTGTSEWIAHMGGLGEAELAVILADLGVK